ncbi:uncharacterized protein [Prorops nasuta]
MYDANSGRASNSSAISKSYKNRSSLPTKTIETRKRCRGPSKRPCLNRNALLARENRQRKKEYLQTIEERLSFYEKQNQTLNNTIEKQMLKIKKLSTEVLYLKNVLNNNTHITALLQSINFGIKTLGCHSKKLFPINTTEQNSNFLSMDKIKTLNEQYDKQISNCKFDTTIDGENGISVKTVKRFLNTDHNYISDNEPHENYDKVDLNSKDLLETGCSSDSICGILPNDCKLTRNLQESDYFATDTFNTMLQANVKKDVIVEHSSLNDLSLFNPDTFDDFSKCDNILEPIENIHDSQNLFGEDLFQNLNNTGICLHINSDKVSLEFCSICNINNTGSTDNGD